MSFRFSTTTLNVGSAMRRGWMYAMLGSNQILVGEIQSLREGAEGAQTSARTKDQLAVARSARGLREVERIAETGKPRHYGTRPLPV